MARSVGTLRSSISQSFKLQGLTLRGQATSVLVDALQSYQNTESLDQIVDSIVEAVLKQPLTTSFVDKEVSPSPLSPISVPF